MAIRFVVDESRCIGSGNCELVAPGTFGVDDDGVSRVLNQDANDPPAVERAILECPTAAIRRVAA
jgi:ferredoxin